MNFEETEAYLLSLGNEVSSMKLGLENIRRLLAALGDPQEKYLKVQVAGTNGKGSVCAFLNSICLQAGIKTGMFTSPHLISITERVQINGDDISAEAFASLATKVREVAKSLFASGAIENVPTYFEQVTAIALLAFAEAKVELAILETGLGGRLDATTAANAEIAAITRIDLDHQQYLGETIEEIAAEKAAIIHDEFQGVVIGQQQPKALRVILERCRQLGIRDLEWEPHLRWTIDSLGSGQVKVATHRAVFPAMELGLRGEHQRENAETAINVIRTLRYDDGFAIDDEAVVKGLVSARHPGRLEWIGRYLLDGAHNIGGARALRNYLDEFVDRPITMIFGAMRDKQ
ncbi:MAG: Mur ligase family protein, partial [Acidobacteriota bacterium]